jgi:hypothetical protein
MKIISILQQLKKLEVGLDILQRLGKLLLYFAASEHLLYLKFAEHAGFTLM